MSRPRMQFETQSRCLGGILRGCTRIAKHTAQGLPLYSDVTFDPVIRTYFFDICILLWILLIAFDSHAIPDLVLCIS